MRIWSCCEDSSVAIQKWWVWQLPSTVSSKYWNWNFILMMDQLNFQALKYSLCCSISLNPWCPRELWTNWRFWIATQTNGRNSCLIIFQRINFLSSMEGQDKGESRRWGHKSLKWISKLPLAHDGIERKEWLIDVHIIFAHRKIPVNHRTNWAYSND